jgi:hypothetical protein
MTEVIELRGTVPAIEVEQSSFKEQYEGLRASYLDLQEIMLREIAVPEEFNKKQKKFKKKKPATPNGDPRRHASKSKYVPDHSSSEEDISSDEEEDSVSE